MQGKFEAKISNMNVMLGCYAYGLPVDPIQSYMSKTIGTVVTSITIVPWSQEPSTDYFFWI